MELVYSKVTRHALSRHKSKEALDTVGRQWALTIAKAVMRKSPDAPEPVIAGTVHCAGEIQEVIDFIGFIQSKGCRCKHEWENNLENEGEEWPDDVSGHDIGCAAFKARELLSKLNGNNE